MTTPTEYWATCSNLPMDRYLVGEFRLWDSLEDLHSADRFSRYRVHVEADSTGYRIKYVYGRTSDTKYERIPLNLHDLEH